MMQVCPVRIAAEKKAIILSGTPELSLTTVNRTGNPCADGADRIFTLRTISRHTSLILKQFILNTSGHCNRLVEKTEDRKNPGQEATDFCFAGRDRTERRGSLRSLSRGWQEVSE